MTRPRGTTSHSEEGRSEPGGTTEDQRARAAGAGDTADAGDDPVPVSPDVLDERDRRQARRRKKPGPTRTPPADPAPPPTDAPATEI